MIGSISAVTANGRVIVPYDAVVDWLQVAIPSAKDAKEKSGMRGVHARRRVVRSSACSGRIDAVIGRK